MKILIIEDDSRIASFLRKGFAESNYTADVANCGLDGLKAALARDYDLIILDIMIPGIDGWEVLTRLRGAGNDVPVIFLTARDSVQDRVRGLELGADDYLVKPFAFSELLARIHTIFRRGPTRQEQVIRIDDLEIDLVRHRATRAGRRLDLTAKEFLLLELLARRSGEIMSRGRIAERIWNLDVEGNVHVVDVHMTRLRAKVDDPFEHKLIHTVRGMGYVLENRRSGVATD